MADTPDIPAHLIAQRQYMRARFLDDYHASVEMAGSLVALRYDAPESELLQLQRRARIILDEAPAAGTEGAIAHDRVRTIAAIDADISQVLADRAFVEMSPGARELALRNMGTDEVYDLSARLHDRAGYLYGNPSGRVDLEQSGYAERFDATVTALADAQTQSHFRLEPVFASPFSFDQFGDRAFAALNEHYETVRDSLEGVVADFDPYTLAAIDNAIQRQWNGHDIYGHLTDRELEISSEIRGEISLRYVYNPELQAVQYELVEGRDRGANGPGQRELAPFGAVPARAATPPAVDALDRAPVLPSLESESIAQLSDGAYLEAVPAIADALYDNRLALVDLVKTLPQWRVSELRIPVREHITKLMAEDELRLDRQQHPDRYTETGAIAIPEDAPHSRELEILDEHLQQMRAPLDLRLEQHRWQGLLDQIPSPPDDRALVDLDTEAISSRVHTNPVPAEVLAVHLSPQRLSQLRERAVANAQEMDMMRDASGTQERWARGGGDHELADREAERRDFWERARQEWQGVADRAAAAEALALDDAMRAAPGSALSYAIDRLPSQTEHLLTDWNGRLNGRGHAQFAQVASDGLLSSVLDDMNTIEGLTAHLHGIATTTEEMRAIRAAVTHERQVRAMLLDERGAFADTVRRMSPERRATLQRDLADRLNTYPSGSLSLERDPFRQDELARYTVAVERLGELQAIAAERGEPVVDSPHVPSLTDAQRDAIKRVLEATARSSEAVGEGYEQQTFSDANIPYISPEAPAGTVYLHVFGSVTHDDDPELILGPPGDYQSLSAYISVEPDGLVRPLASRVDEALAHAAKRLDPAIRLAEPVEAELQRWEVITDDGSGVSFDARTEQAVRQRIAFDDRWSHVDVRSITAAAPALEHSDANLEVAAHPSSATGADLEVPFAGGAVPAAFRFPSQETADDLLDRLAIDRFEIKLDPGLLWDVPYEELHKFVAAAAEHAGAAEDLGDSGAVGHWDTVGRYVSREIADRDRYTAMTGEHLADVYYRHDAPQRVQEAFRRLSSEQITGLERALHDRTPEFADFTVGQIIGAEPVANHLLSRGVTAESTERFSVTERDAIGAVAIEIADYERSIAANPSIDPGQADYDIEHAERWERLAFDISGRVARNSPSVAVDELVAMRDAERWEHIDSVDGRERALYQRELDRRLVGLEYEIVQQPDETGQAAERLITQYYEAADALSDVQAFAFHHEEPVLASEQSLGFYGDKLSRSFINTELEDTHGLGHLDELVARSDSYTLKAVSDALEADKSRFPAPEAQATEVDEAIVRVQSAVEKGRGRDAEFSPTINDRLVDAEQTAARVEPTEVQADVERQLAELSGQTSLPQPAPDQVQRNSMSVPEPAASTEADNPETGAEIDMPTGGLVSGPVATPTPARDAYLSARAQVGAVGMTLAEPKMRAALELGGLQDQYNQIAAQLPDGFDGTRKPRIWQVRQRAAWERVQPLARALDTNIERQDQLREQHSIDDNAIEHARDLVEARNDILVRTSDLQRSAIDEEIARQPDWLTSTLGPRPEVNAVRWQSLAGEMAANRLRFGLSNDADPGIRPDQTMLADKVAQFRAEIGISQTIGVKPDLGFGM